MAFPQSFVDGLEIASPCTASWAEMQGTDRVRFCSLCSLNVYDLSAMSRDEAEALVRDAVGRVCVRFYRRKDGTVLTQDCPRGIRALTMRCAKVAAAILAFVMAVVAPGCSPPERHLMGDVAVPPPHKAGDDGQSGAQSRGVLGSAQGVPEMGESRPESR
jgi:hypothetical protein